ncbi:MAG: hypothetical protein LUF90_07040 [Rikenellaceae bacterium]|nr:hypothetical protein [Rikenellaceae bacterium]
MQDLITYKSVEFTELIGKLRTAKQSIRIIKERHRPMIGDERYLTGEQVMT